MQVYIYNSLILRPHFYKSIGTLLKNNIYKGLQPFFLSVAGFLLFAVCFCPQKLFTIAVRATTSEPQKAHKYLIFSCLYCLLSVSVINN